MRIGAETLLWGSRIVDLAKLLETLAKHQCKGVEFSHRPDELGNAKKLQKLLSDYGLVLVGLSGGTLEERLRFCGDVLRPEFLYVEGWEASESEKAVRAGFTLAISQRMFSTASRMDAVEQLLNENPKLKFVPDTMHLTVAGYSPAAVIAKWKDRLAAVHVKDWTPVYGRSSHRYARGIVNLGEGIVNLEALFLGLRDIAYDGWLMVGQGSPQCSKEQTLRSAVSAMCSDEGLFARRGDSPGRASVLETLEAPVKSDSTEHLTSFSPEEKAHFLETVLHVATRGARDRYQRLAQGLCLFLKAKLVTICECNTVANVITFLGVWPARSQVPHSFVEYRDSLARIAIERQTVTLFDLTLEQPGKAFDRPHGSIGNRESIGQKTFKKLICIPILNPANPHHPRLAIEVYYDEGQIEARLEELSHIGKLVAQAADSALDERCAFAAAITSVSAGQCQQSEAFLGELLRVFANLLDCSAVSIFLVNDAGDSLEEAKSTGLKWIVPVPDRFYRLGEGLTGRVWKDREALLLAEPTKTLGYEGKSNESGSGIGEALLCAPMIDAAGAVIGVVRCQQKRSGGLSKGMFSQEDLTILDAICQTAVPHLQVILSRERRAKALRRLSHELNNPLVGILGAADRMKTELARRDRYDPVFSEDYVGDIQSWVELMRALIGNADFFQLARKHIRLDLRRVWLYSDVFMPAINQIQEFLRDREFNGSQIVISRFQAIPPLWLDKRLIIQTVFNLLTNAIKYAHQDPKRFLIRIDDRETPAHYEIDFCDFGIGIAPDMNQAIFLEGVRSKEAEQASVSGDGLGLWIARTALKAHDSTIELTNFANPTKFTISIPKWRAYRQQAPP